MSESIIQTHTSSLLERGLLLVVGGGQRRKKRRQGKRRKEGIKAGVVEERREGNGVGGGPGFRINLYVP